jgi:hypothetical protein
MDKEIEKKIINERKDVRTNVIRSRRRMETRKEEKKTYFIVLSANMLMHI